MEYLPGKGIILKGHTSKRSCLLSNDETVDEKVHDGKYFVGDFSCRLAEGMLCLCCTVPLLCSFTYVFDENQLIDCLYTIAELAFSKHSLLEVHQGIQKLEV